MIRHGLFRIYGGMPRNGKRQKGTPDSSRRDSRLASFRMDSSQL